MQYRGCYYVLQCDDDDNENDNDHDDNRDLDITEYLASIKITKVHAGPKCMWGPNNVLTAVGRLKYLWGPLAFWIYRL